MAPHGGEDGITIVEIVVALLLLGIVLTAFLRVMVGGLGALVESGQRQDSSQVATEVIEVLRSKTPAEIALRYDAGSTPAFEVDLATVSNCTAQIDDDGDGSVDRTPPGFDPDGVGVGSLTCEELRTSSLGAINTDPDQPFYGSALGVDVVTVATVAQGDGVPDGVTRVTVVMTFEMQGEIETVRRQSFFSGVSRG